MAGERRITPIAVPTWVASWLEELTSLRDDFREHAANDNRELGRIRDTATELAVETGKQSAALARIESSLARRAKTEDAAAHVELVERSVKRRKLHGAIIGLICGALGALVHHFFG